MECFAAMVVARRGPANGEDIMMLLSNDDMLAVHLIEIWNVKNNDYISSVRRSYLR